MKVLVTGGAGFIGSNLVDELIDNNYEVVIIDNLFTGKKENINTKATFYEADIRNDKIKEIFEKEKPEIVIHHAAQISVSKSIENPAKDSDINITGTVNLLQTCVEFGVKKIIYSSSAAVYGIPESNPINETNKIHPISFYGLSKYVPEEYIRIFSKLYGLKYTIFRYANVFGERQDPKGEAGVISIFSDKIKNSQSPIIFGNGENTRDYVYVKDVVRATILALDKADGEIINIGTNKSTSLNELFIIMKELMDFNKESIYLEPKKGDILHSKLNNAKAEYTLKWKPKYTLKDGLKNLNDHNK